MNRQPAPAPVAAAPVTTTAVKPGTHQINVSAPGYDQHAQSIDIPPGRRDLMVRFQDVRLDAKVEVVHTHGISSCRGTLIATPQGTLATLEGCARRRRASSATLSEPYRPPTGGAGFANRAPSIATLGCTDTRFTVYWPSTHVDCQVKGIFTPTPGTSR